MTAHCCRKPWSACWKYSDNPLERVWREKRRRTEKPVDGEKRPFCFLVSCWDQCGESSIWDGNDQKAECPRLSPVCPFNAGNRRFGTETIKKQNVPVCPVRHVLRSDSHRASTT